MILYVLSLEYDHRGQNSSRRAYALNDGHPFSTFTSCDVGTLRFRGSNDSLGRMASEGVACLVYVIDISNPDFVDRKQR